MQVHTTAAVGPAADGLLATLRPEPTAAPEAPLVPGANARPARDRLLETGELGLVADGDRPDDPPFPEHDPVVGLLGDPGERTDAWSLGQRVADGGDLHLRNLEARRRDGALEDGRLPCEPGREHFGHRIARCHDAVELVAVAHALPDSVDVRVRGAEPIVDLDAAGGMASEAAHPSELVARADARGEDHELGLQHGVVVEPNTHAALGPLELGRSPQEAQADAEPADVARQHLGSLCIELARQQARRCFHHLDFAASTLQRAGRLEPEQAAATHDDATAVARGRGDPLHVLGAAVRHHPFEVGARDRRDEGPTAGREDQAVVLERGARLRGHHAPFDVDRRSSVLPPKLDAHLLVPAGVAQLEGVQLCAVDH